MRRGVKPQDAGAKVPGVAKGLALEVLGHDAVEILVLGQLQQLGDGLAVEQGKMPLEKRRPRRRVLRPALLHHRSFGTELPRLHRQPRVHGVELLLQRVARHQHLVLDVEHLGRLHDQQQKLVVVLRVLALLVDRFERQEVPSQAQPQRLVLHAAGGAKPVGKAGKRALRHDAPRPDHIEQELDALLVGKRRLRRTDNVQQVSAGGRGIFCRHDRRPPVAIAGLAAEEVIVARRIKPLVHGLDPHRVGPLLHQVVGQGQEPLAVTMAGEVTPLLLAQGPGAVGRAEALDILAEFLQVAVALQDVSQRVCKASVFCVSARP